MSGERLLPDPLDRPPDEAPERPAPERPAPERPAAPPPWELEPTQEQRQPKPDEPGRAWDPAGAVSARAEDPTNEPSPYFARFQLILGALLGIAAVAVVAALLIGTGPSSGTRSDWSPWSPGSDKASDAAQEIANHIAPSYRLDSGGQLVAITGGQLEVADLPARLALAEQGRISVLKGDGVLYTLCGLGPKCSINSGLPTQKRHLLLRREALELALYTFRYVRGTDYVVALLPPRKGTDPTQAMFFRKDDLEGQLDRPLNVTLSSPPPRSSALNAGDISSLEALTARRLFEFKFEQAQDASVFLVLQPFASG